ncbi:MAG: RICIN domain-containing protein [Chitinophagaceae bacterium]|nr:RICIN domain-containing protein [Oligoflexus sp.]
MSRDFGMAALSIFFFVAIACTPKASEVSAAKASKDRAAALAKPLGGRLTSIRSLDSNKCLDASENSFNNGQKIVQLSCQVTPTQRWQIHANGADNSTFVIRPDGGGDTVIDISRESGSVDVVLWKYTEGNVNQLWKIVDLGDLTYSIRSLANLNKCLGFAEENTDDNSRLSLLDCSSAKNLRWSLN